MSGALFTGEQKSRWKTDGWCVVESAFSGDLLSRAQEAVWSLFPTADEMDSGVDNERTAPWRTSDAPWPEFPFDSDALNQLVVHEALIEAAGEQAWPFKGFSMAWHHFVTGASVRQLTAVGFPPPGHPYWNAQTLAGVQARYRGLDMSAWTAASPVPVLESAPEVKILVTGGTGFVGSHAVGELQRSGHIVRLLARNRAKVAGVLDPLDAVADEVVEGDMTNADQVSEALEGCDAVVHSAAEIGVAGGRGPTSDANIEGTRLVIDGALDRGLDPVVYTSTVTVHLPTTDSVLGPESPLAAPLSVYGAQKCAIERFVQDRQRAGAPITTLVVGGVYGPISPHLDGSFSAILASLASGMYAPDSGMGVVDVHDLAVIIGRAVEPDRGPRRYLVSGRYVTWEDWAALLAEASGRPVPYHRASPEDMITMGRKFDELRATGADLPPLSEEAAVVMSSGRPGDDSATLTRFGVSYRPTVETFRDTVTWLRDTGHLPE